MFIIGEKIYTETQIRACVESFHIQKISLARFVSIKIIKVLHLKITQKMDISLFYPVKERERERMDRSSTHRTIFSAFKFSIWSSE